METRKELYKADAGDLQELLKGEQSEASRADRADA